MSLCSVVFWELAVVMMKKVGEKIHPVAMNLIKTTLGAILVGITLYIIGEPLISAGISALIDIVYSPSVILFAYLLLGQYYLPWKNSRIFLWIKVDLNME